MTRLLLALDNWRRRASEAGLGLPLGILAVTATFWLVVWLADHALQGSISPVGALTRIYGTGAMVLLTLLMVAIAIWMLVQRLGYRDVFFDGQGGSTEEQSPAPKWDSSIPDFTGQITKLVSSMDAPAAPLPPTAPAASAAPAVGNPQRNDNPADEPTPSADQAVPPADEENGQKVAPAPEPTKPAASPAANAPAAAIATPQSSARPAGSSPAGKSAKGKSAPGKSDPSKNAPSKKAPGKKAQAKSCASKPLLKRKGRK